jgi:ubiquinone/menaquinone biosynthesis C-methylase UbiE
MIVRLDFGREARRTRTLRIAPAPASDVHVVAALTPDLPFRCDSVDEIFLDRSLAHTEDFPAIMEELWRVSKHGTIVHVRLPHASSSWAVSRDPRHTHLFTLETFNYFDPHFKDARCASAASFQLEHARLYLTGARRGARGLALARGALSRIVEGLVNQNRGMQYRWERWFAPIVGGFEEFYVVLSVVKEPAFR